MVRGLGAYLLLAMLWLSTESAHAQIDVDATVKALRLRNGITGGLLPVSDPIFANMVTRVQAGDLYGAALLAANSRYFADYLARRLALQMQTPALDETGMTDNDATAFLIAHFTGAAGTVPRLSTIFSENATYLVVDSSGQPVHAADISFEEGLNINWTQMVRINGQEDATGFVLPVKHVGGYLTLSDRPNDNSFAIFGATAGTNLRMIAGFWEIATGLTLMDVASQAATVQQVPRFVPSFDPNFFVGQGQPACMSCHAGGMVSLDHGYSTVANTFDVTGDGFIFVQNSTTGSKKSLGSDRGARGRVQTCNLSRTPTPVCNPESPDVDPNNSWNVAQTWQQSGTLKAMGWVGPTQGQGLQALGYYAAQSWIFYQNLTQRVIGELCPLGTFSETEINRIAGAANPWADPAGTDDIRTIVAMVAASPGCL